ncbi:MAG: hypothetical protein JO081_14465 [Alphaproteobacteria bacterium]|nr:hypothetical protein [Alphaproteobacteria bacterium]
MASIFFIGVEFLPGDSRSAPRITHAKAVLVTRHVHDAVQWPAHCRPNKHVMPVF